MRNKYSKEFELEMQHIAKEHTLDELLNISKNKYSYDIKKNNLRTYLSKRHIKYKDYDSTKANNMGKYIPIGTEYVKPDGMIYIKIANNKWQYKQRYIYEKYYNVKLTNDDYIIFLDHDRSNFDINNLKKISKKESAVMANQHLFSDKADVTKVCIDTAKLIIKLKEMREDMNIYEKQMKDLKLNPKEYAELTGIPYELVKDVIYDKEGNYSMQIRDFLRKSIFDKHQEIEQDKENMKLKGMEMKMNNDNEIMKWYKEEYSLEKLKEKFGITSIQSFADIYRIEKDGVKVSQWFYNVILSKNCLKSQYRVSENIIKTFVEQLYDIMVNDNGDKYMTQKNENNKECGKRNYDIENANEYLKWYKSFDVVNFLNKNNLSYSQLAKELDMPKSTCYFLVNKSEHYSIKNIKKLYDYVMKKQENNVNDDTITTASTLEEPVVIEMNNQIEEPVNIISQRTMEQDVFKKLLINRLTEEEKELILLFNGKLEI